MKVNWDKTDGIWLGEWSNNPPFTQAPNTPIKFIDNLNNYHTKLRYLGVNIGNNKINSAWTTIQTKINDTMAQRQNKNTTIMGKILVANACIVGMINYTVMHNTITKTAIAQMKKTINKHTCGSNTNIRYENITLQRSHGNIVTLIDIEKHVETLQATQTIKFINKTKIFDD